MLDNFIKNKCEQYLLEKKIYYYKNQYYINMLKMGCENISFPINYDKVVIEFKGLSKTFVKCKNIDKFIRKSNSIYKGIFKLKNNYILVFYCCQQLFIDFYNLCSIIIVTTMKIPKLIRENQI